METEIKRSEHFIVIWLDYGELWEPKDVKSGKSSFWDRLILKMQKSLEFLFSHSYTFVVDKIHKVLQVRVKPRLFPELVNDYQADSVKAFYILQDRDMARVAVILKPKKYYVITCKETLKEAQQFAKELGKIFDVKVEERKIIRALKL